jgi:tetratricopeptide (TPR) repeat protein
LTTPEGLRTPEDKLDKNYNPYLALLELPIRRFITTNYDLEIERALLLRGKIQPAPPDKEISGASVGKIITLTTRHSFSQKEGCRNELAKFPLARYDDNQHMVFHCHGRVDDIHSCVITEADYQRWYLKDVPASIPFRQTLDLTLSSNPILIIGYGLGDIDLMRWLRMITANRPEDKSRNPLFCINYISKKDFESKWHGNKDLIKDECDALYLRYGLHVIPVYHGRSGTPTLCDTLLSLRSRWEGWWDGLLQKPKFRATPTRNFRNNGYYHYRIDFDKSRQAIAGVQDKLREELDQTLEVGDTTRPGLAVVVGDGGTGKSWSVQKYLNDIESEYTASGKEGKFIFWSSYYANDVLTGIDRLIEFLSPHGKRRGRGSEFNRAAEDRFDTLIRLLIKHGRRKEDMFIVFDGIEKLLTPDRVKTDGRSISPEVEKFFRIISDNHFNHAASPESRRFKCKIILTTRVFPLDILPVDRGLGREGGQKKQEELRKQIEVVTTRCWKEDLLGGGAKPKRRPARPEGIKTFKELYRKDPERREKISALCALVDGHTFCIALIRGILEGFRTAKRTPAGDVSREQKLDEIERNIASTPIDRRVSRVIQEAIRYLDEGPYKGDGEIVKHFIERIALFMHPVRTEVARVCFEEAEKKIGIRNSAEEPGFQKKLKKFLTRLVKKNLLQLVFLNVKKGEEEWGYVVHPLVRNYVHQNLHKSLFVSLPSLQLSGITTMEIVDPGTQDSGVPVTTSLFERLCNDAVETREGKRVSSDLCRGAFSILRSRFCANTVTRWGDYKKYLQMVVRLYDTSKAVSDGLWKHHEPTGEGIKSTRAHGSETAPLYADEVAWVYNEIGLTSISMGHLLNAIPFREQGLELSRLIDNDRDGRYLFQAEFNLSTAYIFLGRLSYATEYLKRAFVIAHRLRDAELISRTRAYIAYVNYLQGNLEQADKEFKDAYRGLENNPRARGVFYCYHGETLLKMNRLDEAKVKIDQSRHIGEAEFYPDLIAYARLASANLLVKSKKYDQAQNEFSFVLKEARRTRLRRLETGVLSGMSRLAYKLNDSEIAKQRAIESLKISNEYALCLHQTIGLIVLGKALVKEGTQRELGIAYIKTARDMAKSQGYFLRTNEADQALQEFKVE